MMRLYKNQTDRNENQAQRNKIETGRNKIQIKYRELPIA